MKVYSRFIVPLINLLMSIMIASLPFSVNFYFKSFHAAIIYPAEILICMLAFLFIMQLIIPSFRFLVPGKKFLMHPVTVIICIYLLTVFISAIFSTMHLVSLKSLIIKSVYILVFYFLVHTLINKNRNNVFDWIKIYGISFSFIILYALFKHARHHFTKGASGYVSEPFYGDHTIYAAVIVFLIPAFFVFSFMPGIFDHSRKTTNLFSFILGLLCIGFYFSYCRAAWISFFAAVAVLCLIKLGLKFKGMMTIVLTIFLFIFINRTTLVETFKKNRIDSNINGAGLYEQLFSLTNVTNDLSNRERLNRWKCAIRMAKDKPFLGFGPGTFQFQYLPYQHKEDMTYISVRDPYHIAKGNGGSAHSEYLLATAESGILAFIAFIALGIMSLNIGLKLYRKNIISQNRVYSIILLFPLITYFIHGLFNNFLDNCKMAFLFWFALSALVTMDLISQKNQS